jgi:membrane-associated phospholipid phosphatase
VHAVLAPSLRIETRSYAWLTLSSYAGLSLLLACLTQAYQLDARLFVIINQLAGEYAPDEVLEATTMFGQGLWMMALISPLLLIAPRVNAAALFATPLLLICTHVPKLLFHWARPSTVLAHHGAHILEAPISMNTFPSGHALVAGMAGTVVILGWGVLRRRPWTHLPVLALITLIALSRVAVGAHWPIDVLVGAALGVLVGYGGNTLAERYYRNSPRAWVTVAVIYGVCAIVLAAIPTHHALQDLLRNILAAMGIVSAVAVIVVTWRTQLLELLRPAPNAKRQRLDGEAIT